MLRSLLVLIILLLLCNPSWAITQWCDEADAEGCWLNEDSGDLFNDSTSNNRDGTASGDPTHGTATPPSGVNSTGYVILDGSDYNNLSAHIADFDDFTIGTIVSYVRLTSNGADDPIFWYGELSQADEHFWFVWDDSNAEIDFIVKGNNSDVIDGQTNTTGLDWEDGNWHHFGYTTGASSNQIYMDGVAVSMSYDVGSGSSSTNAFFNNLNDVEVNGMRFGMRDVTGNDIFLTGDMDESAIFTLEHDSTDINDIMDNGLVQVSGATEQIIMIQ